MAAKTVTRSIQRLMPRFEPTALLQKSFFSSLHETKVKSWHFLNPKPTPCQIRANEKRAFSRCMTNIININWHDYAGKLISNCMISAGIGSSWTIHISFVCSPSLSCKRKKKSSDCELFLRKLAYSTIALCGGGTI